MARSISITEILKTAKASVDFNSKVDACLFTGEPEHWVKLMQNKLSPELIEMMMHEGQKTPIMFYRLGGEITIGNGHHRLTAAILLGWDEILIEDDWNRELSTFATDLWECEDQDALPSDPDVLFLLEALEEVEASLCMNIDTESESGVQQRGVQLSER